MKAVAMSRGMIKGIGKIVDIAVLIGIVLMLSFAAYALWDSNQIYQAADKSHYAVYKPTIKDEGKSFKELQSINPEVFSWLSVYGTNIDYPVTQGQDNMKYVNTNAEGLYSLSGAIFLDHNNNLDFCDFNSIVYGHHMEKKTMFGEIGDFSDSAMFESHQYGNLYYDGANHGIEFFAFLHTDAYDRAVFSANVKEDERQSYLDGLLAKAKYTRNIIVTEDDHIIMLSTCSSDSTNGRDILIGRIGDDVYENLFLKDNEDDKKVNHGTYSLDNLGIEMSMLPRYLTIISASLMFVCTLLIGVRYGIQKKKMKQKSTKAEQGYL